MLDVLLIAITFIVLLIASYTDLRTREVPDWLNYSLIFAALGIRSIFAFDLGWSVLVSGLLGLVVCLGVAFLFYYAGQWGGGDSKLLMGMGAVIGITYPFSSDSFLLLWYFLGLLFLGAIYGVGWMGWLAFRNRKEFGVTFKGKVGKFKGAHYGSVIFSGLLFGSSFFWSPLWVFVVLPIGLFYLLIFVSSVEDKCFTKRVDALKLTEGDWLAEDVVVNKKVVMRKKTLHAKDLEKLWKLSDNKILKDVVIKEGIPFIPSFLFAYVMIVFGSSLIEFGFSFLF